jgi:hypothetical protein
MPHFEIDEEKPATEESEEGRAQTLKLSPQKQQTQVDMSMGS